MTCDTTGSQCRVLSSGSASFTQASFGADFGLVTVTMPPVDESIPGAHWLAVVLAVPDDADRDLWVVFDSVDYPSRTLLR
ncbi:MAG: hypothetical protein GWO22_05055 [Actinobacteria bacterium]|nr:hypothetical protein [Actinomycetota bacterium]